MLVAEATSGAAESGLARRGRTIALLVVLLAFFMDVLDATIVNVAIPTIQEELGASYSAIQWIVAGYSLAFALVLITGGRLGDIFGYRSLFLVGIAGFTIASGLSGLATTAPVLVGARLLQGVMAALMVPQVLAVIQVMYTTTRERRIVSVFYGSIAGVATVAGPIIGAILIDGNLWGLGWRTIFLVNLPIGVAAMILGAIYLPKARSPHPLRLDLVGVGVIVLAMLMLMYPLIQGRQLDWPAWAFVSMAGAIPVFALFAWTQIWKERRDGSPLVVPELFRQRSFVAGISIVSAFFAIVYGFFLVFMVFLQAGLGYAVLEAGLTIIPFSVGVCGAAALSGPILVPRFGRAIISVGPIIMASGLCLLIAVVHGVGGALTPWELVAPLLIAGIGMGFVVAPIYPFMLAEVPIRHAGSASGIVNAAQQVGGAIGVALVGTLFFGLIASNAGSSIDSVRVGLEADLAGAGVPASALPTIVDGFERCFADRVSADDLTETPESCRQGEQQISAFAGSQPQAAAAIGGILDRHGRRAGQRDFSASMEQTLLWMIAGLVAIFFATFWLPLHPRLGAELAALGVAIEDDPPPH